MAATLIAIIIIIIIIVIIIGVVGLIALTDGTTSLSGTPVPAGGDRSQQPSPGGPTRQPRAPDDYTPPEDGTGWATAPFDQPAPVPGYNWQGWGKQPTGRCAWLPADLFASLATGPPKLGGHFCHIPVAGGDDLQILWGGTYSAMHEQPAFVYPVTVAGLEARVYDLPRNQEHYPGSCHIKVNTRSLSMFSVLNWNPHKQPGDREARCKVAMQAAELIARRMVPAAGGTIWQPTPQQLKADSLTGRDACTIVSKIEVGFAAVAGKPSQQRTDQSDTCTYDHNGKRVVALVSDGPNQGLDQVPPPEHANITPRKLGVLPGRQEVVDATCAIAVELLPGRLLRTQYSDNLNRGQACKAAEVVTGEAVQSLLDEPSPTVQQPHHRLSRGIR